MMVKGALKMMLNLFSKKAAAAFLLVFLSIYPLRAECGSSLRTVLKVSAKDDLVQTVASAKPGTTILLKNGLYKLTRPLIFKKSNVWIRSESGKRNEVVLDGHTGTGELERKNCINEIIGVMASDVMIADISICHARDHGIHVSPQQKGNIKNIVMDNIHIYDCGQQLIKVNSNGSKPLLWVDAGVLKNSLIEFIDNSIMQDMGDYFYTGGIDVHGGRNWLIQGNTFRNIQRENKMMEHAVHMWFKSRGTVIEQNRFINCFRAVGLGMKIKPAGLVRVYKDGKGNKPYIDHIGGVVQSNFIFNDKGVHQESGIELMNVSGAKVYHNTIVSRDKPFSSIEYRWPNTRVRIMNNIVSHNIMQRNGAKAVLEGNIKNAGSKLFQNLKKGNLHLSSKADKALNKGAMLKDLVVKFDIDGDKRDNKPDIGADEL